jgi:epoxyqueuosine reductase
MTLVMAEINLIIPVRSEKHFSHSNNRRIDEKMEMMKKDELIFAIQSFAEHSKENRVIADDAIYPHLAGMRIFDSPLVGFSSSDDELYTRVFKREGVIHPLFMAPREWMPEAKTVISFFLPFTDQVRESNRTAWDEPYKPEIPQRCSAEWLHGRIEGQAFVNMLTDFIEELLQTSGFRTISPTGSGRVKMLMPFCSNWSERHAAFASGLGTFGLSKGLITEKGMAGRIGSVITDAFFEPSPRPYTDPFEYCKMCGACELQCPANAIDKSKGCKLGKDQNICAPYVNGGTLPPHGPRNVVRYGCGKCQVGVPCEKSIPQ